MPIDFQNIPITLRVPGVYVEIDNRLAFGGLFRLKEKILVLGQKLAAGTAAANTPVQVTRTGQAAELFGRGSMLHAMFVALKEANGFSESWALPLDDNGAGVAATGTITIGGAPTAAGTLNLYVAGKRVQIAVASGEAALTTAAALNAAINADLDLPVTSVVNVTPEQLDITARHKGETGNDIDLRVNYFTGEQLPAGLTVAFVALAGGTGNPDITAALAALADEPYEHIVMPYTDAANLTLLETFLLDRWGPLKMVEGFAYSAAAGTHAALTTLGNSRNSFLLSVLGAQNSPTPPWIWAAVYGATVAFNANNDPARPFQTLTLKGILPPNAKSDLFTLEERDLLLNDGIATWVVDAAGKARIERAITTYEVDAQAIPDPSFLDVNTVLTLSFLRRDLRFFIGKTFPRHKLADDGTPVPPGSVVATPSIIRDHIIARFLQWQEAGLAEDIGQFKQDLVVQRHATDVNRVDALVPVNIVNQLRIIAALVEFRL